MEPLPPGFRFSPTDEELMINYLRPKAWGRNFHQGIIAEVDVYKFEPWDLPEKSALPSKDSEWYFFSAQDKKYSHTARINRTTRKGYWKATGKDRKIYSGSCIVGLKKTLIYYEGRAPNGGRTNWIMHEYRLNEACDKKENDVGVAVLCRIRKKGGLGPRNGEQYGAPVWNESGETEEDANLGNVEHGADTDLHVVKSSDKGSVFNLQNQVEVWKRPGQMEALDCSVSEDGSGRKVTGSLKASSDCIGTEKESARKGTNECEPDINGFFRLDMAPNFCDHRGYTFPCHPQYIDMQYSDILSDADTFPPLPTLSEDDGHCLHDYVFPSFDESEILGEMWELVNNGDGGVSSKGANEKTMSQTACNVSFGGDSHLVGGDFIELDDINVPLDELQDWLHSEGLAAQSAQLQIPASKGRLKEAGVSQLKAAHVLLPEVEKRIHEGSSGISIPIARENYKNIGGSFTGSYSGSGFNYCDTLHLVESSTRSFLSKHMSSSYAVKCQMVPAQLCYASLTDVQDGNTTANNTNVSSRALIIKDDSNLGTDAFEKIPATSIDSSSSSGLLTENSSSEARSPDVEDLFFQGCNTKIELANRSSSNGYSWKTPLRGLVSKAKRSALGIRLLELESGMRAKFTDKFSALGKPAAQLLPTEGCTNPYDSLRKVLLATLCRLAAAVLIFFCLFWGFHILTSYAVSVSV